MNFREQLVDSSRLVGNIVAEKVGENPEHYKQILDIVLTDEIPMSSRAGRVLDFCTIKNPGLITPHIARIFNQIKKGQCLHRSVLKIFSELPVTFTEEQEGMLVDACFKWLADDSQAVAIKVYCMEILGKFAQKEPGIIPELVSILEEQIPTGTAGIKSRSRKIIRKLRT